MRIGTDRRTSSDHDVIMSVVRFVGTTIWILAFSVAFSLAFMVAYCVIFNKPFGTNLSLLIAAVSTPLGAALGYIAGLLTNSKRDAQPQPAGTAADPLVTESKITNPPNEPVQTQDVKENPDD